MSWSEGNEQDLYPYLKNLFQHALGYPQDRIRIGETKPAGYPDLSLLSRDSKPKDGVFWIVAEVKPDRGTFRSPEKRREVWDDQLKRYVSADTVYALLIDPITVAVLRPDGSEVKVVHLDALTAGELAKNEHLGMLSYENSLSDISLESFKEGSAPSRYLDVTDEATRRKFYDALRLSSRELIDYSRDRVRTLLQEYADMEKEIAELEEKVPLPDDPAVRSAKLSIQTKHASAKRLKEIVLRDFEKQIGRDVPTKPADAERFLIDVYATEGSSLVLARILFVRFFEDHDLTTRKISNGGIKAFRNFYRDVKDDYRHLLSDAFKDLERRYRRLFEPSLFDLSHEGDGELSRLLLRIFYRLNAFNFTKVTGDILGNLYERFLDVNARKKLGEFYTPITVARYVLERIGFYDDPAPILDPACGSGTFLIAAVVGLIERMRARGVSTVEALKQSVELVHGLDINMFAAFITQLQLIWHLFPYLQEAGMKEIPDLRVYGGINSLVYDPQSTLGSSMLRDYEDPLGQGARVRDGRYRYIVGNPPYIRNERFKDWGEWRAFYHGVDHKNADVAFFFVDRAISGGKIEQADRLPAVMPPWLQDGGRMCWVLPLSICDSAAAAPLRERLLQHKVLEITDLDDVGHLLFPSALVSSRGTTAPMLFFSERRRPHAGEATRLVRVSKADLGDVILGTRHSDQSEIAQELFWPPSPANPYGQILTKLREADIPLLRKLGSAGTFKEFAQEPTPTYGVTVGGAGIISEKRGGARMPLLKGQNIFAFHLNPTTHQWVDPLECRSSSIWASKDLPKECLAFSNIALAPQASGLIPAHHTINDSAIVFVPKADFADLPWEVIANSAPLRFFYLLALRSGLLHHGETATYAHVYPRTVDKLPVPSLDDWGRLSEIESDLRALASAIARRWETVDATIAAAQRRKLALCPVLWEGWDDPEAEIEVEPRLASKGESWRLNFGETEGAPSIEGPRDLLKVVSHIISEYSGPINRHALERMEVPNDPAQVSVLIDQAGSENSPDRMKFRELASLADDILMDSFGFSKEEKAYVRTRLSEPPLGELQPRWPWISVAVRAAQEYEEDRFE